VNANPGSDLPAESAVVLTEAADMAGIGVAKASGGFNVVGRAGLNAALRGNARRFNQRVGAGSRGGGA
jgi:hypothetical protein